MGQATNITNKETQVGTFHVGDLVKLPACQDSPEEYGRVIIVDRDTAVVQVDGKPSPNDDLLREVPLDIIELIEKSTLVDPDAGYQHLTALLTQIAYEKGRRLLSPSKRRWPSNVATLEEIAAQFLNNEGGRSIPMLMNWLMSDYLRQVFEGDLQATMLAPKKNPSGIKSV